MLPASTEVPDAAPDPHIFAPGAQVIDNTTLDELRTLNSDGSADGLRFVLTIYLDKSPQLVAQLAEAVETGDAKTMGQVAHSLKSASANVGATKLSSLCEVLEKLGCESLGHPHATDDAADALSAIQGEHEAVQGVLVGDTCRRSYDRYRCVPGHGKGTVNLRPQLAE